MPRLSPNVMRSPLSRECRLAGRSDDGLAFLLDLSAHGEVRRVVALKRGVGDRTPES
jgi:hypothetical protein